MSKKVVSVRLPVELEEELRRAAQKKGVSFSAALERAVEVFLSLGNLLEYHDPEKEGVHYYIYLAPPEQRKTLKKPLVASFIKNWTAPKELTEEELEELKEAWDEDLKPGEKRGVRWVDLFDTPEEALAMVAWILGEEMGGFSVERFAKKLKEVEEAQVEEEEWRPPETPRIYGVLSGKENILEFLKAREQDALKGSDTFRKMMSELHSFVVEIPGGKRFRTSSLKEAEEKLKEMGYGRAEIEYSLLLE